MWTPFWDVAAPNSGVSTQSGQVHNTYAWDPRGQLASITQGATTIASFGYDAFGRRTSKTVSATTTGYRYDVGSLVQELSGTTVTANILGGVGVDEVISRTEGTTTRYFLPDRLGSTVGLTDSAGTIQTEYSYDPFGVTTTTGQTDSNSQQYTGRENDGTGLYYYRARYYDPELGRFISEDPIGFAGGDINLYAYVGNNPTNATDPSGLIGQVVGGCVAGAVTGAVFDLFFQSVNAAMEEMSGRKAPPPDWGSVGKSALLGCAEGAAFGAATLLDDGLAGAAGAACSFSADTEVETAEGEQAISKIEVGDRVLAYDEETGVTGYHEVSNVWKHDDPVITLVVIDGETIEATPEHPFYTEERGWVTAGELWAGAHVRDADGGTGIVETTLFVERAQPMYNLTVEVAHTYFIGDGEWLVHNSCKTNAEYLYGNWHKSTFPNRMQSIQYHWETHGRPYGVSIDEYTDDALAFFQQNQHLATTVTLADGSPGLYINLGSGQGGGYYTTSGEIVSFWYD